MNQFNKSISTWFQEKLAHLKTRANRFRYMRTLERKVPRDVVSHSPPTFPKGSQVSPTYQVAMEISNNRYSIFYHFDNFFMIFDDQCSATDDKISVVFKAIQFWGCRQSHQGDFGRVLWTPFA